MSIWNKIIITALFGVMASSLAACYYPDDGYYYRDYAYNRYYGPPRYYYYDRDWHDGYHGYWRHHRWYDD